MDNWARPLVFVDLDDTLFQTHRRLTPNAEFVVASYDKNATPLAYMSDKQQMLTRWLWQSTDVVPVTARSPEALARVALAFHHGAICAHGAIILDNHGNTDPNYHAIMRQALLAYQPQFRALTKTVQDIAVSLGSVRLWTVAEQGVELYLMVKQNDLSALLFLPSIIQRLPRAILAEFYCHSNGNNLAIIPKAVSKAFAVQYYLEHYVAEQRVTLGFGDSLSDMAFLSLCDFWGAPRHSQISRFASQRLATAYKKHGYFGDYDE